MDWGVSNVNSCKYGFELGKRAATGAIAFTLVGLASCGRADQATVNSGSPTVQGPSEAPAELAGAPAQELSVAVGNDGASLVLRRKAFEPADGIAGASLIGSGGKVSPVGELPEVTDPQALAVDGGFAVGGYNCTERVDGPEDDCVASIPIVAFIDASGKVTAVTKAPETADAGMRFSAAHEGVVAVGVGASILHPDGSVEKVPATKGGICGAPRGESRLLGVLDTPSDPSKPEESPGTLQGMVLNEEGWTLVGRVVEAGGKDGSRDVGDLPRCGDAMIGVAGWLLTDDSGWAEFPLEAADLESLVGLTASKEVAVLRDGQLELISSDGGRTPSTDDQILAASLSPDGTKIGYVSADTGQLGVKEVPK